MENIKRIANLLEEQTKLPVMIVNNNVFKIRLNYFVCKNIILTEKRFFIYNTYLFNILFPFFLILFTRNTNTMNLNKSIVSSLLDEGFEFNGYLYLN